MVSNFREGGTVSILCAPPRCDRLHFLRVTRRIVRLAKEAGGRSVGCTIELPSEQPTNAYLDRSVRMHYFFARETLLVKYSYAFVVYCQP
jgi:hypothetical protein